MIKFVDLKKQYLGIKKEIDKAIGGVIKDSAFIGGERVKKFEKEFAYLIGAAHCVGVGNGTDALFIALKGLGIGQGDEVIVPANTFIATAEAVSAGGASVVFADCEEKFYCLDISDVKKKITAKTKAVIAVHLYGQPANMDELSLLCRKHKLFLIEDTAQAHLAKYKEKTVGTIGDVGCFSFYPGKNLGAYGDAGAIVTDDEKIAFKCRLLANHGRIEKYDHLIEGYNSRLDSLQAAILSVKLKYLKKWNKKRRCLAQKYNELLKGLPIVCPEEFSGASCVYHLYVIRCKERDQLRDFLKSNGIETGIHYPVALPFLKAYDRLAARPESFPVSFRLQNEILSLPLYPELTEQEIRRIVQKIKQFYASK